MSFPNLDHLLVLPSGCGEQNLVKTAINFIVAKYLLALKKLSNHVAIKIKNNIQIGKVTLIIVKPIITFLYFRLPKRAQLSFYQWLLQHMGWRTMYYMVL